MKRMNIRFNAKRGVYERVIREEDVVVQVMALLRHIGFKVHREKERIPVSKTKLPTGKWAVKFGGKPSDGGHPDLHGWIPARMTHAGSLPEGAVSCCHAVPFYIEMKRPGGRIRPKQFEFIKEAKEDGVVAFFADSWEAVRAGFAEHGIQVPNF